VAVPGSAGISQGDVDAIIDPRLEILDLRVQGVIGEQQKVLFQPVVHHSQAAHDKLEVDFVG